MGKNRCRSEGEQDVSSGRRGRGRWEESWVLVVLGLWDLQEQRQRPRIILGDDDHSTEDPATADLHSLQGDLFSAKVTKSARFFGSE